MGNNLEKFIASLTQSFSQNRDKIPLDEGAIATLERYLWNILGADLTGQKGAAEAAEQVLKGSEESFLGLMLPEKEPNLSICNNQYRRCAILLAFFSRDTEALRSYEVTLKAEQNNLEMRGFEVPPDAYYALHEFRANRFLNAILTWKSLEREGGQIL